MNKKPVNKKPFAGLLVFLWVLFVFIATQPASASAQCSDDQYMVHPELLKMAFDKVAEKQLNQSGRAALLKLYKSGISTGKNHINQLLKNLPNVLTAIEATEAIYAGDYKKLSTMAIGIATEQSLETMGVPLVGQMLTAAQIVKTSYDDLHQQECLLNIDLAYYRFLDDPKLNFKNISKKNKKDRISYYLNKYIHGEGLDPFNNPRELNRKYLQCYVDKEMPDQKIQVDYSEWNPFDRFSQAVQVPANNPGLRTAVYIMLSDFDNKRKIEVERKNVNKYRQRKDYEVLKQTLPSLGSYPLLQDWICDAYLSEVTGDVPNIQIGPHSIAGEWSYLKGKGVCTISQSAEHLSMICTYTPSKLKGPHYEVTGTLNGNLWHAQWKCLGQAAVAKGERCKGSLTAKIDSSWNEIVITKAVDPTNEGWVGLVLIPKRSGGNGSNTYTSKGCANLADDWKQTFHWLERDRTSTWKLTRKSNRDYTAKEIGLGGASGTATFDGEVLTIVWENGEKWKGEYEWWLNDDCSKGTGTVVFSMVPEGDKLKDTTLNSTVERQ